METQETEFAALIGIDWADRKHDLCLEIPGTARRERSVLEHRPEVIDAWAAKLRERFGGRKVAVALELSRGPLVSALLEHDFFVIFPINPSTLAKYRQAFAPSRAKDDPTDAECALELLTRHRDKLTALRRQSVPMRSLQRLVESRRMLVHDRVRITNRITHALKTSFPQVVDWFRDKETEVFAAFLERWPSLKELQGAGDDMLRAFFKEHNVRYAATIDRRVAEIRAAKPLTTDAGVLDAARLLVQVLLPQLRAVSDAIAQFDAEIERQCAQLPDHKLFRSLPGAGPVYAARLLAAFGEQRELFPNAASLQRLVGIAPVTERSGNKNWVHWRIACGTFARQTFVEWAAESTASSFWAGAFYRQQRAKGASRHVALRALAFKWIRILYRCWVDRSAYDESRYLAALQKRGSPLLKFIAQEASTPAT